MPFHFIETLKSKAGDIACHTPFYDWSLSTAAPDRLRVKPVDPWPGDADKAQNLLDAAGVEDRTGPQWYASWWSPEGADDLWASHMHGFGWLRDLRTYGGPVAKEQGRLMIENWIETFGNWSAQSWRADITGRRLAMWICHYDFFCDGADLDFDDRFLASIVKQAKHLSNATDKAKAGTLADLDVAKGLIYAGIALSGHEKWIEQGLSVLDTSLSVQILSDGGHVSRNPSQMLDALEILVDVRSALGAGDYPVPAFLEDAIEHTSAALRLVRHRDRRFALFNGTQEGDVNTIDSILAQGGTAKKAKKSLPSTGYERAELGRSLLLVDTGKSPDAPYDLDAHAAPLAFEFSHGKERIFVSCGTHPLDPEWKDALRFTGGHSTACLDNRNACEIKKDGHFGRKVTKVDVTREETKDAVLIRASHNGYVPLNGITHGRKLYLSDDGDHLRGQDDFTCLFDLVKPVDIALRFHVHPNITASIINDGQEVLMRMPGVIGWRFKYSLGALSLEDSLYLGSGIETRKTKQIVIHGTMRQDAACIKWSLKREG